MRHYSKLFASCFLIAVTLQGRSATQISNLMTPWTGGGIGDVHAVTPNQRYGFSFTTGAVAQQLDSVVLEHFGYPGSLQQFSVELYQVDGPPFFGMLPVSPVGTLANSAIDPRATQWPGQTTFVSYSSTTAFTLAPSTTYMIAANEPPGGLNETGVLFTELADYSVFGDWTTTPPNQLTSDSSGLWFLGLFGGGLKLEINATPIAVPEPSVSILVLSLACLVGSRSRKR